MLGVAAPETEGRDLSASAPGAAAGGFAVEILLGIRGEVGEARCRRTLELSSVPGIERTRDRGCSTVAV